MKRFALPPSSITPPFHHSYGSMISLSYRHSECFIDIPKRFVHTQSSFHQFLRDLEMDTGECAVQI